MRKSTISLFCENLPFGKEGAKITSFRKGKIKFQLSHFCK